MNPGFDDTETVVRHHLLAFLEQQGLDAILDDYADDACFFSESRAYCGTLAIRAFFEEFIAALPPQAIGHFPGGRHASTDLVALRCDRLRCCAASQRFLTSVSSSALPGSRCSLALQFVSDLPLWRS